MHGASWINVLLGVWLILVPWVLRYSAGSTAASNSVVVGLLVLMMAAVSLWVAATSHALAWINVMLGTWVFFSPWFIGYQTEMTALWNHVIVGALIIVFALVRAGTRTRASVGPGL
jgi:hypothetical protein